MNVNAKLAQKYPHGCGCDPVEMSQGICSSGLLTKSLLVQDSINITHIYIQNAGASQRLKTLIDAESQSHTYRRSL